MDGDDFSAWLDAMKEAGWAETDAQCGALLDLTAASVINLKNRGADIRTGLACTALLLNIEPYHRGIVLKVRKAPKKAPVEAPKPAKAKAKAKPKAKPKAKAKNGNGKRRAA